MIGIHLPVKGRLYQVLHQPVRSSDETGAVPRDAFLLLETGDFLLLENSRVTLENYDGAPSGSWFDETRQDLFLDMEYIEEITGPTFSVKSPTKSGSNPLIETGVNAATYDYDKTLVYVRLEGSTYVAWVSVRDNPATDLYVERLTSNDGITWAKPNYGLVNYGGDTNNALILDQEYHANGVLYDADADADQRYLMVCGRSPTSGEDGIYILKSADGITFTEIKTVQTETGQGSGILGASLVKHPSGRYIALYQDYRNSHREISAYISATSDVTGAWTDLGVLIAATGNTDEKYWIGVHVEGEQMLGFVPIFNEDTDLTTGIDLYLSYDGIYWTLLQADWLTEGAGGAWDDSQIYVGHTLTEVGNEWWYYYTGAPIDHAAGPPYDARIGLATFKSHRIGGVGNNGTVKTKPVKPGQGKKLNVNTDASGGSLDVALLDAYTEDPVSGYDTGDFDTITSDTVETEATWGGNPLPTGQAVKLKFTLTNADLYSYAVED